MKRMIELKGMGEGEFLNRWMENRTIRRNQNVLGAITGATGSSKSMDCLSAGNNWYNYKFKQNFPIENCCFSPIQLIKRINYLQSKKKLRKGEFFILEESGTSLGNLDYQGKLQKMFVYILQSFRSMNLILFLNLPVLTMLNKSARQLIHFNFITCGIDYVNKFARIKPLFHQLNQNSGKSYWKYPRIKSNGRVVALERLKFSLPPEDLIEEYEEQKFKYVNTLTEDFIKELDEMDKTEERKMARKKLTDIEQDVFEDMQEGLTVIESSEKRGRSKDSTYEAINRAKKKGFSIKRNRISKNP